MTQTISIIIACAIQLLSVALAYQYLSHRGEEKFQIKSLWHVKFDKLPCIICVAALLMSVCVFLWGAIRNDHGFMRSLMNAEVMIWLIILGYIDAREKIIPNGFILVGLLFWLVLTLIDIFVGGTNWVKLLMFSGIGGIACGGLLFVVAIIVKSALGMGDVKLFFVLGLLYGLTDTYGILISSIVAMGVLSVVLLIAKKITTKSTIPMAPFVTLGFILSILAGM